MDGSREKEAQDTIWKQMTITWMESYQPVRNVIIDMGHKGEIEE